MCSRFPKRISTIKRIRPPRLPMEAGTRLSANLNEFPAVSGNRPIGMSPPIFHRHQGGASSPPRPWVMEESEIWRDHDRAVGLYQLQAAPLPGADTLACMHAIGASARG